MMASRTSYGSKQRDGTSLVAMRWIFAILVMFPAVVGDKGECSTQAVPAGVIMQQRFIKLSERAKQL